MPWTNIHKWLFVLNRSYIAMSSCSSVLDVFRIIPLVKALHSVVFLTAWQLPRLKRQIEDNSNSIWSV